MGARAYLDKAAPFADLLTSRASLLRYLDSLNATDWEELLLDLVVGAPATQTLFPQRPGSEALISASTFMREMSPSAQRNVATAVEAQVSRLRGLAIGNEEANQHLIALLFVVAQIEGFVQPAFLVDIATDKSLSTELRQLAAGILAGYRPALPPEIWTTGPIRGDPDLIPAGVAALAASAPETALYLLGSIPRAPRESASLLLHVRSAARTLLSMPDGVVRMDRVCAGLSGWGGEMVNAAREELGFKQQMGTHGAQHHAEHSLVLGTCYQFTDTSIPALLTREPLRSRCWDAGLDLQVEHTPWAESVLDDLAEGLRDAQIYNRYETEAFMRRRSVRFVLLDVFDPVSAPDRGTFYLLGRASGPMAALAQRFSELKAYASGVSGSPPSLGPEPALQFGRAVHAYVTRSIVKELRKATIVVPAGDMSSAMQLILANLNLQVKEGGVRLLSDMDAANGFQAFVEYGVGDFFFGGQDQRAIAEESEYARRVATVLDAELLELAGISLPPDLSQNSLIVTQRLVASQGWDTVELLYKSIFWAREALGSDHAPEKFYDLLRQLTDGHRPPYERQLRGFQIHRATLRRNRQVWRGAIPELRRDVGPRALGARQEEPNRG